MENLKSFVASMSYLALGVAGALGIGLSVIHDAAQLLLLPVAEWARIAYIVEAQSPTLAENVVNFFYQLVTFGIASFCVLFPMPRLLAVRSLLYPAVTLITCLMIALWWVPFGFLFGFDAKLLPALPFISIAVLASVLAYAAAAFLVLKKELG